MKTKWRIAIGLFALLLCAVLLCACGLSSPDMPDIEDVTVDKEGNVTVKYENGTKETLYKAKTIVSTALDESLHLIVTYSDGTVEDLGYAGLAPCTVTFVDHDGTFLGTAETYMGLGAKAPVEPTREDYNFTGWDKDISKITESTTVMATYAPKPTYTVVFKNDDGTVLKTETVVEGKFATPPVPPSRADLSFAGWDTPFVVVMEDLVVTATYVPKDSYQVTFLDYNGLVLETVTVKEGATATPKNTPVREGYTFKGWSGSLLSINAHKTVTAQYTLNAADNVFDIAYKVSGETVTLTVSLAGNVCVAGFEGGLSFAGMTATAVVANSPNALANLKDDGTVYVAYTSATNVTKGETVMTVTLKRTADAGKAVLTLKECFRTGDALALEEVAYTVIGQDIRLK